MGKKIVDEFLLAELFLRFPEFKKFLFVMMAFCRLFLCLHAYLVSSVCTVLYIQMRWFDFAYLMSSVCTVLYRHSQVRWLDFRQSNLGYSIFTISQIFLFSIFFRITQNLTVIALRRQITVSSKQALTVLIKFSQVYPLKTPNYNLVAIFP